VTTPPRRPRTSRRRATSAAAREENAARTAPRLHIDAEVDYFPPRIRPKWRNGRRGGFKIRYPQGFVGSSPTFGTSSILRDFGDGPLPGEPLSAGLGTLTPTPLPEGEGLGTARIFPLYPRERGTEGVREPRRRLVNTLSRPAQRRIRRRG
jgi:hypothetical protein